MTDLEQMVGPLLSWFDQNKRILPWREDTAPYRVWVSEIMLQQTRVESVKPYFERFMKALPDIHALADADEEQLLKLWEGLGYYNRARNLQKAARQVVEEYGGQMPGDVAGCWLCRGSAAIRPVRSHRSLFVSVSRRWTAMCFAYCPV